MSALVATLHAAFHEPETRVYRYVQGTVWALILLSIVLLVAMIPMWAVVVLLAGAGFHLGIAATMHVGTFSWVALAAYPVLLHPETGARLWAWVRRRSGRDGEHRPVGA